MGCPQPLAVNPTEVPTPWVRRAPCHDSAVRIRLPVITATEMIANRMGLMHDWHGGVDAGGSRDG